MFKSLKTPKTVDFDIYSKRKSSQNSTNPWRSEEHFQHFFFKEYFPKYLKKFIFASKEYSLILKIKRVKIIQDFRDTRNWSSENWSRCLRTKMKNIKMMVSARQTPPQFFKKMKLFSNLSNLQVDPCPNFSRKELKK